MLSLNRPAPPSDRNRLVHIEGDRPEGVPDPVLGSDVVVAAAQALAAARRLFVLSGAGMSRACGIPTYRDPDGVWTVGHNLDYASAAANREDAAAFARFWAARYRDCRRARPGAAHFALRDLQRLKPGTVLATQNIDGLLQQAGCVAVLELHGNLYSWRCDRCGVRGERPWLGRCRGCLTRMRPDIVLFGESLTRHLLFAAQDAAQRSDVVLVVGTSAEVYPAAELPLRARRSGATLIVVDPRPPATLNAADLIVAGRAEVVLPALVARVARQRANVSLDRGAPGAIGGSRRLHHDAEAWQGRQRSPAQ